MGSLAALASLPICLRGGSARRTAWRNAGEPGYDHADRTDLHPAVITRDMQMSAGPRVTGRGHASQRRTWIALRGGADAGLKVAFRRIAHTGPENEKGSAVRRTQAPDYGAVSWAGSHQQR